MRIQILLVFLAACLGFSQDVVDPERVGLSSERLARIDARYESEIAEDSYAGAVVLVARDGKIAHLKSYGMSDKEEGKAMTTDTIFRWASMSKIITATAAMILFEEGKFFLDDPVANYIPEFADPMVLIPCSEGEEGCENYRLEPAARPITIRHLMTHSSGISYGFQGRPHLAQMYWDNNISDGLVETEGAIGDMVKRLAALPLYAHPGEVYEYGLSIDVLGYLVEVISGQDLASFMSERIFVPLNMVDTSFFVPEDKVDRLAKVYAPGPTGGLTTLPDGRVDFGAFVYSATAVHSGPQTYYSGGGGLCGTINDYFNLLQMLASGGRGNGKQILSPTTVSLMTANHIGDVNTGSPGAQRGLGMALQTDRVAASKLSANGSFFWGGFWNTYFHVDQENGLIAIGMTQLFPFFHLRNADILVNLSTQAIVGPSKDPYNFKK